MSGPLIAQDRLERDVQRAFTDVSFVSTRIGLTTITVPSNQPGWRDLAAREMDAARRRLQRKMGRSFLVPIHVVVADSDPQYRTLCGSALENSLACARLTDQAVILNGPLLSKMDLPSISATLLHELVHLYLEVLCDAPVPLWIHEGVAQIASEILSKEDQAFLSRHIWMNSTHDLADLIQIFPTDPLGRRLAYVQSRSIVEFLIQDRFGGSLGAFVDSLAGPDGVADLISFSQPVVVRALQIRWLNQQRSFGGFSAAFLEPGLLMGGAFLLLICAYVAVSYRRAKARTTEILFLAQTSGKAPVLELEERQLLEIVDPDWPEDADLFPQVVLFNQLD